MIYLSNFKTEPYSVIEPASNDEIVMIDKAMEEYDKDAASFTD